MKTQNNNDVFWNLLRAFTLYGLFFGNDSGNPRRNRNC
jgi:hypothetical protein